jgi:hypothetical protein
MSRNQFAVMICLALVMAGCDTSSSEGTRAVSEERDRLFAETIATGITLDAGLSIEPDRPEFYAPHGSVGFFVSNRTGYDLVFENNRFGVQGFVFNEAEMTWEEIDLGFTPLPAGPHCVRDGATEASETWAVFTTQWMDTKEHSEVRLLVIGYTAGLAGGTPGVKGRYGAYADIRIIEGGTVVPTPTAIVITPFPTP